ncbi:hypothetical protein [uncultured Enterococcus sp.]|uniref:hypothetical protein n=1 Tax=uncultured Enterococcus sp. TaxID=167972 RepID=UPI0025856AF6|nr:hypothetical protein [uncultured Enterococcus sp.]
MKNRTKVIEKELKVTAEEFRHLYKNEEHSQIGKRVILYTDAATKVGDKILAQNPAMVALFNQMKYKEGYSLSPLRYHQATYQKFIEYGINQGYKMDDVVRVFLFNRIKDTCISCIAEMYAIIMMIENFDNIVILTNEKADLETGVDFILVYLPDMIAFPVHVTTQAAGKNSLNEKETRVSGRNNRHDVALYYNKKINDSHSFKLGEFAFFKKYYLRCEFNDWKNNKNDWHPGENVGYRLDDSEFSERFANLGGTWELFKANKIEKRYEPVIEEVTSLLLRQ